MLESLQKIVLLERKTQLVIVVDLWVVRLYQLVDLFLHLHRIHFFLIPFRI